jgi:hypothetical protein
VEQAIVGAPEFVKLRMSKLRLVSGRAAEFPIANHASVPLRASFTVRALFSAQRMQGRKKYCAEYSTKTSV